MSPRDASEDDLRSASDRVERLLEEVRAMTSPMAWQRVEQLVHTLVELYGDGLARTLAAVDACGALDDRLRARLADDELVSTLLTLHGLHPQPAEARIRAALERAGAHAAGVVLDVVDGPIARFSAATSTEAVRKSLERLVADVAPEIGRVELAGAAPEPLVQIDLARSRARSAREREA